MKKMKRYLPVVWLLAVLVLAACAPSAGEDTASTPQPVGLVENVVSASGEVVPARVINLSFPTGGQELELFYQAGDFVEKGRLIAQVDRKAAEAAVASAKSGVASAQAGVDSATAQVRSAEANLERVEDSSLSSDKDIEAAKAALAAAQSGLEAASLGLEAAKAGQTSAEQNWIGTYLFSPFAGTIVEMYGREGESAAPGAPLALYADLSTLQVETTDLNEVDVARVQVGDPVRVSFDALPDTTASGTVSQVALKNAPGSGVYFTVTITLDEIPADLRWGMSAFVEITVSK